MSNANLTWSHLNSHSVGCCASRPSTAETLQCMAKPGLNMSDAIVRLRLRRSYSRHNLDNKALEINVPRSSSLLAIKRKKALSF